jgi:hypothetical protein
MRNTRFGILLLYICVGTNIFAQSYLTTVKLRSFDTPITVDIDFLEKVKLIDSYAANNQLEIITQQSLRILGEEVTNQVVKPYYRSNHYIGHAIDINIKYKGELYNSTKLRKYGELPEEIKGLIVYCRNNGIRWGGYFKQPDVVHFDDNIDEINPRVYEYLFQKYQGIHLMEFQ